MKQNKLSSLGEKVNKFTTKEQQWNLEEIYKVIQQAVFEFEDIVEQMAIDELSEDKLKDLYLAFLDIIQSGTNKSADKINRQCTVGCNACCYQKVPVTGFEAIIIARHIKNTFYPDDLKDLLKKLKNRASYYKEVKSATLGMAIKCGFLNDKGRCMIYKQRPARCSGYFSSDAKACENLKQHQSYEVPIDVFAGAWVRGVHGVIANVIENHGLDSNFYELNGAVLTALNTDNVLTKWLQGEDVFKNCAKSTANYKVLWYAPQIDGSIAKIEKRKRGIDVTLNGKSLGS